MQAVRNDIVTFLIVTTAIIFLLAGFMITLLYLYQKKKIAYQQRLSSLQLDHEKNLLESRIEIQENTFQHISREIHDNIALSLTLAKLQLNTLDQDSKEVLEKAIISSVDLISKSLEDLNNLSKALDADIIKNQGLINALDKELERIQIPGLFAVQMLVKGNPVFLAAEKELIIFRILQEAFNNIIKHSRAKLVKLTLHYNHTGITIRIVDDGIGFQYPLTGRQPGAGLNNITTRALALKGRADINSIPGKGTRIHLIIPYEHE